MFIIKKSIKSEKITIENEKIKCGIFISDEGYGHMVRQRAIIHELLKKVEV